MSTANWRHFARQPSGIMTLLLLMLLLAFHIHTCPMPTDADPAPAHGCCHDTAPDLPASSASSPCHNGPCLQAFSDHGGLDLYGLSANGPDWLALTVTNELSPPDWLGQHYFPPPFITASGPPPAQRSRILRL